MKKIKDLTIVMSAFALLVVVLFSSSACNVEGNGSYDSVDDEIGDVGISTNGKLGVDVGGTMVPLDGYDF